MCIKGREGGFPIDLYTTTFSLQQGIFSMLASKKKAGLMHFFISFTFQTRKLHLLFMYSL